MDRNPRSIIGKTITGIISRPGRHGQKEVLMMQFSDGSCFELVSPIRKRIARSDTASPASATDQANRAAQLSFSSLESLAA